MNKMEKRRFKDAMWIPAAAVLSIGVYAIGMGAIFTTIFVNTPLKEWGVIGLGVALVVGVPVVAALLERNLDD